MALDERLVRENFPTMLQTALLHNNCIIESIVHGGQWKKGWPKKKPRKLLVTESKVCGRILDQVYYICHHHRRPPTMLSTHLRGLSIDFERLNDVLERVMREQRWELLYKGREDEFRAIGYQPPKSGSEVMLGHARFFREVADLVSERGMKWLPVYSQRGYLPPKEIVRIGRRYLSEG